MECVPYITVLQPYTSRFQGQHLLTTLSTAHISNGSDSGGPRALMAAIDQVTGTQK